MSMQNLPVGTKFLLQSGPGNTLSLPELHYTDSNEFVAHTLTVLNIEYQPPNTTGYLNVKLNLKESFMLRVANTKDSEVELVEKFNKAYVKFGGPQAVLMTLKEDDTIEINVGDGIIYTNSEVFLRREYTDLDSIQSTNLPDNTFVCYNAVPSDKSTTEWADFREHKYYTEEVRGMYTTAELPTIRLLPGTVYFGFQPTAAQAESFQFPLVMYSPILPTLLLSQQLARDITHQFRKSRLVKNYGFNLTVALNKETREFVVDETTFNKITVLSWIQINDQEPPVARTTDQWQEVMGNLSPYMIIPPIHKFLPTYVSPFTLQLNNGIGHTALLNDFRERVIALFEINNGGVALLFAPKNILNSRYALNNIPLEIKDSEGTKIPGSIRVHVAIT